jgi:hypothetical protein
LNVAMYCTFAQGVAGKSAVVGAGEAVTLSVVTRDRFGNGVAAPGAQIQAVARGPHGAVPFALISTSATSGHSHTFKAELTVAGDPLLPPARIDAYAQMV